MEEDTEYKKLPVDERCVHKLWKARVDGYEEAAKKFREIDDEKSPEWNKYLGLIKKFVVDSNAVAQEKGLEAALLFVENCGIAGKTVGEVISGIVTKCLGAPKAKTKELGIQIALMYIEIEKHEVVIDELIKGFDQKNPKIVATCVSTALLALREFGAKVVSVKPLVKKIPALLSDRDKTVRDESKQLTIEIFRWIGPVFKTQIQSLPQVVLTELEAEFEKVKNEKAIPTRYLRSQQQKQILEAVASNDVEGDDEGDDAESGGVEIDPMDLIDPVDILSKLPKDFYEKLEAKKWQERKEALDALDSLVQNPKLQTGDYGDLVRALKKVITKDTNVVLVALAGKCLAMLAKGLSKKFQPYAVACIGGILEKFKEKKPNVVSALREAVDAIYPSTNLEAIQEDILAALTNKNPSVKSETAMFLARSFTKTIPTILNKKLLKSYVTALLKTLNESDPTVRDASAEAIGTAMKLVGEKNIAPFLTEVDPLKMEKIKEYCEKAVITVKIPAAKKEPRPQTAPAKAAPKGGSSEPKPVARPASAAVQKKAPIKKSSSGISKSASSKNVLPMERDMSQEEVDEIATEILPSDVISGLVDTNWKTRLSSIESFQQLLSSFDAKCGHTQVLVRVLAKKPGLKDTNFQVLKLRLDAVTQIVDSFGISVTSADYIVNDITEKLGDPKNSSSAAAALSSIAEAIKLEYVVSKVMTFAFEQKSPKVQQESLLWVSQAIKDFGFQINPKLMIDDAKKGVNSTNPTVRQATINLLGTMFLYMGNTLMMFFDNEKPALKQQIQSEFDKFVGQKPPTATRGPQANGMKTSGDDDDDDAGGDDDGSPVVTINPNDLLPRIDISPMITESLIAEISDKNWKTRNEGLVKFQGILNEHKLIKSNLGELPPILAQRLIDSNAKIAQTAVEICQQLATSMGPSCKQHVRILFPGILRGLGDNKAYLRSACITCINTWGDQCGYKEFFDGEMFADALKSGTPSLKTEVWGWMAEKLPNMPTKSINKEELIACLPHLYANICDRNADVRKNANECVLGIMMHLGYDAMMKAMDKQKPATKKDIQAALDKARPNLPVKPLPKGKQQAPVMEEKKVMKSASSKAIKGGAGGGSKPGSANASSNKKKEEDVDLSPLFQINNSKHQRLLDEQKMKVLKWNFTTPREEFTDLLKEQMNNANVNKSLMANMFHDDFRYHLKVIESLIEDLNENFQGLICNLDLVLKWLSLRFYDTNPSVLLKGLEYLNLVFQRLVEVQHSLTDVEGSSFIPHLLTKIGDPKDAVRNGVRHLLRQICHVYSFSKVFAYVMDALKSKNARQRTECLDELGYLIETYNLSVCQPTPQHALKEIARQISDRDNSVRSAALNCIVKAHELAGERVYKMIGQLNEKDLSMLDERIKRSKKSPKQAAELKPSPSHVEIVNVPIDRDDDQRELSGEEELPSEEDSHPVTNRMYEQAAQNAQRSVSGPFKLNAELIADIEKDWVRADQIKQTQLSPLDLSFTEQPIRLIPSNGVTYPTDRLQHLLSKIPTRPQTANVYSASSLQHYSSPPTRPATAPAPELVNLMETSPRLDTKLLSMIKGIGHPDRLVSHASLNELSDILESQEKQAVLRDYDEIYIQSVLEQFKHLSQRPVMEAVTLYQPLLSSLFNFFNSKTLGQNLSLESIKNLIAVLLGLMSDHKFGAGEEFIKVINSICLKILDRCSFTHLNCALVRLLKETCSGSALPKFTELLMKCIWRNVKLIPERVDELDYEALLMEIHDFMLALPTQWWAQRPSDTPMRTIKTIIHNMTKIKGGAIVQHLNNIPKHSELNTYVLRILKKEQPTANSSDHNNQQGSVSSQQRSQDRMKRTTHDQVSNIFKLISDKETSQLGLKQLSEFVEKHPEVDIQPFLRGASPYFQTYINNGLAELKQLSQNNTNNNQDEDEVNGDENQVRNQAVGNSSNADVWMQKLNMYRVRGKLQNDENEPMDNKIADENLNLNQIQSRLTTLTRKDVDHIPAQRLSLLQQKLAQYKQN
ncbi:CLUMA_CG012503, isoform A [Clunio marinus]|uniref:CLUMA_CG012503, isoform A n=1 Tax=Clunio marinus TaxID=568069 RepID=A0A1J1IJA6_9DIPT|nr:CLUMA_CG012503, isoform A [Clunio marinus]